MTTINRNSDGRLVLVSLPSYFLLKCPQASRSLYADRTAFLFVFVLAQASRGIRFLPIMP